MDITGFRATTDSVEPPPGLSLALQTLWWDAKGDWDRAHKCAMADTSRDGAAVHAYLHRKEGDLSNAGHWYARADKPPADGSLEQEWETLARALL